MRDQALAGREQTVAALVQQVVGPDVVGRDVGVGFGRGGGEGLRHGGRHAPVVALGEADLGPLARRPARPVAQLLLQARQREVQQDHEGDLVGEEVVLEVGAGVVGREQAVHRQDGAQVEVGVPAEGATDLEHRSVELFVQPVEPVEGGIAHGRTRQEVVGDERLERRLVAVLRPPQRRHLADAAGGPAADRLAVLVHQRLHGTTRCGLHPGGLRGVSVHQGRR